MVQTKGVTNYLSLSHSPASDRMFSVRTNSTSSVMAEETRLSLLDKPRTWPIIPYHTIPYTTRKSEGGLEGGLEGVMAEETRLSLLDKPRTWPIISYNTIP